MHDFKKLEVWRKARVVAKDIYICCQSFPKEEIFGLTSQIKRSVISIPSNIAEGCGRDSKKQFSYHLNVALGSTFELETQLLIAKDLEYLKEEDQEKLITKLEEIAKMIFGLKKSLQKYT